MLNHNKLVRAYCNLTGTKATTAPSSSPVVVKPNTSQWTQMKDLSIFKLPLRSEISEQDLESCMYGNVVEAQNLTFDDVNAIGDFDIDYGELKYGYMEAMELIRSSKPNRFQESILDVLTNINGDRKEGLNIPLLRDLMSVGGLSSLNGFTATFGKVDRNHLALQFGKTTIHGILDWALWQEGFYFKLKPKSVELHDAGRLILHATELKLEPKLFNYAQLVGQNLLQAHYNREILGDGGNTGEVTSFSLALSGWSVRFMTVRFPVPYLDALKDGIVLDGNNKPTVLLSQPYDLLKVKDRTAVVCALQGRKNMLIDHRRF